MNARWPGHQHEPAIAARFVVSAALLCALIGGGLWWASNYWDEHHARCTVTGLDRVASREGGSDMRVYTRDCGTLAVRDAWVRGEFRSSDLFGRLHAGEWDMTIVGFRFGPTSTFPMILDAQPVSDTSVVGGR